MIRNLAFGHFAIDDKPTFYGPQQHPMRSPAAPTTSEARASVAALSGPVRLLSVAEIKARFPGMAVSS